MSDVLARRAPLATRSDDLCLAEGERNPPARHRRLPTGFCRRQRQNPDPRGGIGGAPPTKGAHAGDDKGAERHDSERC